MPLLSYKAVALSSLWQWCESGWGLAGWLAGWRLCWVINCVKLPPGCCLHFRLPESMYPPAWSRAFDLYRPQRPWKFADGQFNFHWTKCPDIKKFLQNLEGALGVNTSQFLWIFPLEFTMSGNTVWNRKTPNWPQSWEIKQGPSEEGDHLGEVSTSWGEKKSLCLL